MAGKRGADCCHDWWRGTLGSGYGTNDVRRGIRALRQAWAKDGAG